MLYECVDRSRRTWRPGNSDILLAMSMKPSMTPDWSDHSSHEGPMPEVRSPARQSEELPGDKTLRRPALELLERFHFIAVHLPSEGLRESCIAERRSLP